MSLRRYSKYLRLFKNGALLAMNVEGFLAMDRLLFEITLMGCKGTST